MDTWPMTVVDVPASMAEVAADVLRERGSDTIEIRHAASHGLGGGSRRGSDAQRVEVWAVSASDDDLVCALRRACGDTTRVRVVHVDTGVAETWRQHARPVITAGMAIVPSWIGDPQPEHLVTVSIDPEHLFGLGDHPTTRGVLAMLLDSTPWPRRIVDAGCGSGVLGIAASVHARALGLAAPEVLGFDTAPGAREVVARNCERNGVENMRVVAPEEIPASWAQVTVANILAPVLRELADTLVNLTVCGGELILGGLRAEQLEVVVASCVGASMVSAEETDTWWAVRLRRDV